MSTGNKYRKFRVRHVVLEISERTADRQTDTLVVTLHTPTGIEVITFKIFLNSKKKNYLSSA